MAEPVKPIPAALRKYWAGSIVGDAKECGCGKPRTLPMVPPDDRITDYPKYAWCPGCGWLAEATGPNKPLRWYRPEKTS
jgi:hypothetical protein